MRPGARRVLAVVVLLAAVGVGVLVGHGLDRVDGQPPRLVLVDPVAFERTDTGDTILWRFCDRDAGVWVYVKDGPVGSVPATVDGATTCEVEAP